MKAITGALLILAGMVLVSGGLIAEAVRPGIQLGALSQAPRDISMIGMAIGLVGLALLIGGLLTDSATARKNEDRDRR